MVDGWKRHTHPFSIPEHGSKTGNISDIRTKDEPEGSNRGKENIKKSMYTKENKGKNRGAERHSLRASIRASTAENQKTKTLVARSRYAVARK
jgi:hypothetical protein